MGSIDSQHPQSNPRNPWVKKSIEMAQSPGYLDKLHQVYPVLQEGRRTLSPETRTKLEEIYWSNDDIALVRELLRLRRKFRFPIKDPYVAFLSKNPRFLEFNPETVARIAQRIRALGFEGMVASLEEPKESNRQMGTLFKAWLPKLGYPLLDQEDFQPSSEIAFLQGSDKRLQTFANENLECPLAKAPDFIAKARGRYIVGEVKFLTEYGGHQIAQLEDAMRLLEGQGGRAERVAILDGVVWIETSTKWGTKMYHRICQLERPAMSVLLLKDFLESF